MPVTYTEQNHFVPFQFSIKEQMTYFCMVESPCSPHQGLVGCMIQKWKGGWVTLCLHGDKIQRFKLHSLERVPPSEYTEMESTQTESTVEPSWSSPTHSAHLFNVRLMLEESGEGFQSSLTSSTLISSTLTSSSFTSSNSWSSSIKRSIQQHMGRLLSDLEESKGEEWDSVESESSNSTLSSDAEEEYGNSLRVLMNAFVNFLEQAQ